MKIRYATSEDAELLAKIGAETFWDAYHTDSHLERTFIKTHIASTFTPEQMGSELGRENIIYLIAENDIEEVGYVRLLPENSREDVSGNKPIEISRIYLRKKFWGKKFGSLLLERCFKEAEKCNCDVIWLSVWQYNERAIKFYEKYGFYKVGSHIFDLAGDSQIDFLMERNLMEK
jgi:ribosomal protein S18 acetylase RimI-like enzyme